MEGRSGGFFLMVMTGLELNKMKIYMAQLCIMLLTGLCLIAPPLLADESTPDGDVSGQSGSQPDQEQIIKPQLDRREIKIPHIDAEDFEIGVYAGVMSVEDFGANTVTGFRLAYHVTETAFFEVAYGMTDTGETSYERLSGAARLLTDDERKLTYYNVSIGYNLLPGETFMGSKHAFNSALYVIAGAGSTEFGGDNRFTMNFGAGYRLLATDWLAIHADVRDHIFKNDILGTDKSSHNIELHGGLTFFF